MTLLRSFSNLFCGALRRCCNVGVGQQVQKSSCHGSSSQKVLPILTFFTKTNEPCSLCEVAKEVLQKYKAEFLFEEVFIDAPGNEEWLEKYRYDIPVIHLNGKYLMKHRINERLLAKKLEIFK